MNVESKSICKFHLQGRCRFGTRCWNLHQNPRSEYRPKKLDNAPAEKHNRVQCSKKPSLANNQSIERKAKYNDDQLEGACSLASTSSKGSFGPATATVEEALYLVKKVQSREKVCGICFDTVLKKSTAYEQTFGLLPNCNHCFCMPCIKTWRQSKEFDRAVSKACPECRILSDSVFPSKIWLESKEDKDSFIAGKRERMKKLPCKFFRRGKGKCPFGNTCLYMHALPSGKVLDVGPPRSRKTRLFDSDTDVFADSDDFDEWSVDDDDDDDGDEIEFGWDDLEYIGIEMEELMEYSYEHMFDFDEVFDSD
ncbi:unnamed protein product [Phyllotreta striolata]|uniref:RING-type E3 ubiquitin transferase n=1 Tax=Phyllotreta striolata TaxID=444603 RepID=A0A9P0GTM6_PHYSR|nr:unnamed protein product [Phyllotreta striolata]